MLQILGLILIIALIYAVKAVSIARQHKDLAANSASFSYMSLREEDEAVAESWTVEEERESGVSLGTLRGAHA